MKTSSSFTLPLRASRGDTGSDRVKREEGAEQVLTICSNSAPASSGPFSPSTARSSPRLAKRRKREGDSPDAQAVKLESGVESDHDEPPSSSMTSSATSPSRGKRAKKTSRGWDDPEKSKYAHLNGTPDWLAEDLDLLLCGINPGVESARSQHHYAHHSNHFYKALALSGITSRLFLPSEDSTFPSLSPYSIGLTNLASRPTSQAQELGKEELSAGAPILLEKIRSCRPRLIGFVGKGIAEAFSKAVGDDARKSGKSGKTLTISVPKEIPLAWQPESKGEAGYGLMKVCCLCPAKAGGSAAEHAAVGVSLFWSGASTSARVTSLQLPDKVRWFQRMKELLNHLKASGNTPLLAENTAISDDGGEGFKTVELDIL